MPTFRRRTPEVEAIQYRPGPGGNCHEVAELVGASYHEPHDCTADDVYEIDLRLVAEPGDYVIRDGEVLSVMSAEDFEAIYEAVLS
ncbi:MAG TPA: hypothetical protein VHB02_06290 [Acidimicrobiales bacterium]|nr:hypothetical protein [Acidimicrobiales bacterium]